MIEIALFEKLHLIFSRAQSCLYPKHLRYWRDSAGVLQNFKDILWVLRFSVLQNYLSRNVEKETATFDAALIQDYFTLVAWPAPCSFLLQQPFMLISKVELTNITPALFQHLFFTLILVCFILLLQERINHFLMW